MAGILSAGDVMMMALPPGSPNPVYNGIHLGEIIDEEAAQAYRISKLWRPLAPPPSFAELSPREQDYVHALCGMGQEAWPILLSELQAEGPGLMPPGRSSPSVQISTARNGDHAKFRNQAAGYPDS
jgi:hypothetical protein